MAKYYVNKKYTFDVFVQDVYNLSNIDTFTTLPLTPVICYDEIEEFLYAASFDLFDDETGKNLYIESVIEDSESLLEAYFTFMALSANFANRANTFVEGSGIHSLYGNAKVDKDTFYSEYSIESNINESKELYTDTNTHLQADYLSQDEWLGKPTK